MAGNVPSPGSIANGFGTQEDIFGHGHRGWNPNVAPPPELSALEDMDSFFDFEAINAPGGLLGQQESKEAREIDSVAVNEVADRQQDDPLEDLASWDQVAATANEEFRPLLGIPKAGITTYPLVETEERPRKRARFTGVEDGIHERRDEDFQTAVLDAYGSFKTLDPSYQEKTKLADFLELSFEKIDDWFRGRRSGMRPAPPLQIGSSEDHLDIDHESTVTRSNFQDLDCFTEAGEPSDTNLTKASTPTQERPCHCTSTGCSETFKSPSSWARHEKDVHWAQHKFLCLLCAVSGAGSHEQLSCASCSATHSALAACVEHVLQCEEARSQHSVRRKRHTGLKHHLKNAHPGELQRKAVLETVKKTEDWHYPVDSNWPRLCTYINCSQSFRDWKERVGHYTGNHFQKSKRSSRRSFVSFQGEDSIPPTPA